ncbi:MAG TPA: hypothetical protein VMT24_18655, partial [Aggregatilineaceae bacterium]|nr:hypothetical protein [Aggregatilineaceae bacterium]
MANPNFQLGVNMREFPFYGANVNSVIVQMDAGLRQRQISFLQSAGVRLVRIFASHVSLPTDQCIEHVRAALDQLANAGLQAIVCLDDSLGVSGFYVQGTEAFHTETSLSHLNKDYWLGRHYEGRYKDHVQRLVGALGAHPAVWLWEAGNEYTIRPSEHTQSEVDAFPAFIAEFSQWMRSLTARPISSGLISTRNVFRDPLPGESDQQYAEAHRSFAVGLYSTLDMVSLHYYAGEASKSFVEFDINALKDTKPFYIGELGAKFDSPGRSTYYADEIRQQFDANADAVLIWGFSSEREPADEHGVSPKYGDFTEITHTLAGYKRATPVIQPVEVKPATTAAVTAAGTQAVDKLDYLTDDSIPDGTVFQ